MKYSEALDQLTNGKVVTRSGWNGKDMYIFYMPGHVMKVEGLPIEELVTPDSVINILPHLMMKTVQGNFVPWLCSQTDALAIDWEIYQKP